MKVLFVNPHPDDTEFAAPSTCQKAVNLGWEVHELLMTSDEYGTSRNDFKGTRIRKIRKYEMYQAAKSYGTNSDGTPKIHLYWFGEIDGHLRFNREVYEKLKDFIAKIDPDVVFTPEFIFSMDFHPDHYKTGLLTYFCIKKIYYDKKQKKKGKKPLLLLYHSFNPNTFIKIEDIDNQVGHWTLHRSQTTPLLNKLLIKLRKLYYIYRLRKTGPAFAEGFRRIFFKADENEIKRIIHRMLYAFFKFESRNPEDFNRRLYTPPPEQLGISPGDLMPDPHNKKWN